MEDIEMARRAICRVWYRRWGIPQSFTDIGNFYEATTFAALIAADRIEVVREPLPVEGRKYSSPSSSSKLNDSMRKLAAAA
jgi:hypothetical protein